MALRCAFATLLLLCATPAWAAEDAGTVPEPARLLSTSVDVTVSGPIAVTEVTLRLQPTASTIGTLTFAYPAGAALSDLHVCSDAVDDDWQLVAHEAGRGRIRLRGALHAGRPSCWRYRLTELLPEHDGALRYRWRGLFPTGIRSTIDRLSIRIQRSGSRIASFEAAAVPASTARELEIPRERKDQLEPFVADGPAGTDVLLDWLPAAEQRPPPDHLVLAVDASGSIGELGLRRVKTQVRQLLSSLPPGTTVSLVASGPWPGNLACRASASRPEHLRHCLRRLGLGGETDLHGLLRRAYTAAGRRRARLLLFTDGATTNDAPAHDLAALAALGSIAIDVVPAGALPREPILGDIARATGGRLLSPTRSLAKEWTRAPASLEASLVDGDASPSFDRVMAPAPGGAATRAWIRLRWPTDLLRVQGRAGSHRLEQRLAPLSVERAELDSALLRLRASLALRSKRLAARSARGIVGGDQAVAVDARGRAISLPASRADELSIQIRVSSCCGGGPDIDRRMIRRRVRRQEHQLRWCHTKALRRQPRLQGTVVATWDIHPDGSVRAPSIVSTTLEDPVLEACVLQTMQRVSYPAIDSDRLVGVTYSWTFRPARGVARPSPTQPLIAFLEPLGSRRSMADERALLIAYLEAGQGADADALYREARARFAPDDDPRRLLALLSEPPLRARYAGDYHGALRERVRDGSTPALDRAIEDLLGQPTALLVDIFGILDDRDRADRVLRRLDEADRHDAVSALLRLWRSEDRFSAAFLAHHLPRDLRDRAASELAFDLARDQIEAGDRYVLDDLLHASRRLDPAHRRTAAQILHSQCQDENLHRRDCTRSMKAFGVHPAFAAIARAFWSRRLVDILRLRELDPWRPELVRAHATALRGLAREREASAVEAELEEARTVF